MCTLARPPEAPGGRRSRSGSSRRSRRRSDEHGTNGPRSEVPARPGSLRGGGDRTLEIPDRRAARAACVHAPQHCSRNASARRLSSVDAVPAPTLTTFPRHRGLARSLPQTSGPPDGLTRRCDRCDRRAPSSRSSDPTSGSTGSAWIRIGSGFRGTPLPVAATEAGRDADASAGPHAPEPSGDSRSVPELWKVRRACCAAARARG